MLRLIALVLLTATTVSAQSCEFCPGDAAPGNPDYVLLEGLTCADFDSMSDDYSAADCADIQASPYPFLCQCPGLVGTCDGICPDGSAVGRPDLIVQSEGVSCSEYDALAKTTSDATQCSNYQNGYSGYCGCAGVTPTCSGICQDGETLSLPDILIFGGSASCAGYDTTLRFALASDPSCSQSQTRYSGVCGCAVVVPTAPSTAEPTTATMPGTPSAGPLTAQTPAPVPTPVAVVTNAPTPGLTDSPVTAAPITPGPVSDPPVAAPTTSAPIAAPVTSAPVADPVTDAPVTSAPVPATITEAPVTAAPSRDPQTKAPFAFPLTNAPVTSAPAGETVAPEPTSTAPITSAPITTVPVSAAPVAAPADSMAPVSSAPSDGNTTVTSNATAAPSPAATPPPAATFSPGLSPSSSIRSSFLLPVVVVAMSLLAAIF
jgi:hypothetical protein